MCNCLNCNYTTATIISLFKLVLCFACFCDRFGDQKMLLVIHFDGDSIFKRTEQFGPVVSK